MKTILILIVLIYSTSSMGQAVQKNLPVICSSKETVLEVLTGAEFKEKPVWVGRSVAQKNFSTLLVNSENGTWTLVKFDDATACMLDTGDQANFLAKGDKIRKM